MDGRTDVCTYKRPMRRLLTCARIFYLLDFVSLVRVSIASFSPVCLLQKRSLVRSLICRPIVSGRSLEYKKAIHGNDDCQSAVCVTGFCNVFSFEFCYGYSRRNQKLIEKINNKKFVINNI